MRAWIRTASGGQFHFGDSARHFGGNVRIYDIAASLSKVCRFGGHTEKFYSVAEHCVLASYMVPQGITALHALMHDASEAYLGDVSSPLKDLDAMVEYKRLEKWAMGAIYKALGIPDPTPEEGAAVKVADLQLCCQEAEELLPLGTDGWYWPVGLPAYEGEPEEIKALQPHQAQGMFLDRFSELVASVELGASCFEATVTLRPIPDNAKV